MYSACKAGSEAAFRSYNLIFGDVAELVEGTSLLTRQGVKTLMGSNPIVSANADANTGCVRVFAFARNDGIRTAELGTLWASEPCPAALMSVSELVTVRTNQLRNCQNNRAKALLFCCMLRETMGFEKLLN